MTITTETRLSAQNRFFLSEKISSYTWWWRKKSPIEVSSHFSHLKMSENLEGSVKMLKKWVSATTGTCPTKSWNVRTYHYHTSYYVDHRFPIIKTNRFVIYRCDFYLFLNRTVLFICFMTNLSPMRKLFFFRTLRIYNFIACTIASVKRHRVYKS